MDNILKFFLILNFIYVEIKKTKSSIINKYKIINQFKLISYIKFKFGNGDLLFKDENINSFLKKNSRRFRKKNKKNKIIIELLLSHHSESAVMHCLVGNDLAKIYSAECIGIVKKNDYLTMKIANSFGIKKFRFFESENLFLNFKYFIMALNLISPKKIEKKIFKLKYNGLEIGKAALESYYRFFNSDTKKINKIHLYIYLSRAIKTSIWSKTAFKTNYKFFVIGETQFVPHKILFHSALKSNIPVLTYDGSSLSGYLCGIYKKYSERNNLKNQFTKKFSKILINIFKKNNIINNIKKIDGIKNIGKETIWAESKIKNNFTFLNRSQFNNFCKFKNNKKNILILPHAMSDNIFNNKWNIFNTSYDWFSQTLSVIKKIQDVNWIIKPHPYEYKYPGITAKKVFNQIIENKKNIFFLDETIHINKIFKYIDAVITGNGTAGYEYSSLGIPSITTSDARYSNFNFTYAPKTKIEYFNLLKKINKIKKLDKDKIKNAQIYWYAYEKIVRNCHNFLPKIRQHGRFKKSEFFKLLNKKKFVPKSKNLSHDISFQIENNNRNGINSDFIKKYKNFNFKYNDA